MVLIHKSGFYLKPIRCILFQEGETAVHFAAELLKSQAHHDFEDTDIIKLILDYGGDTNTQNKLVGYVETSILIMSQPNKYNIMSSIPYPASESLHLLIQ